MWNNAHILKKGRKPFEVQLSDDDLKDLEIELSQAIQDALAVRSATEVDCEYFHRLYEQGRTRGPNNSPWADAADLTSYLGTQYVDVLRSQIVQTVMTDPVFTVEGYGDAAQRAPFVEEFHQWQLEAEGFQQVFARGTHLSLIEPMGVIEVYEDTIKRPVRKVIQAALQTDPITGAVLLDEKMQPMKQIDPMGKFVEQTDPNQPAAEMEIDSLEVVCRGPRERTIAYRDFLMLPGHARDKSEIWGYAKRFFRRLSELQARAKQGMYDKEAVEDLGTDDERPSETSLSGEPLGVAQKDGTEQVEKELWEVLFLRDLDGKGPRWFVCTIHVWKQTILRIQYDDIGKPRYFPLIPFPKPNSIEGYSYIGHKLITVIEEHTAWRNMTADDAAMQLQLPVMRRQGALWDPDEEPMGPKAVLNVRDFNDLKFLERNPNSEVGVERIRDAERAGERLSGINDASAGITSQDKRTLGEVELITQQSQGRTSEAVKNIQETLEDIWQVRHIMWKRALADMGDEGMLAPPSVAQNLAMKQASMQPQMPTVPIPQVGMGEEMRAPDIAQGVPDVRFTAAMLEGQFRAKPRGSVETADRNRMRFNLSQMFQALSTMAAVNPMVGAMLATPMAAKALVEQVLRLFDFPDKQAFLGNEALAMVQQMMLAQQMAAQQQQMQQQMGGGPKPGSEPPQKPGAGSAGPPPAGPPMMGMQAA